MENSVQRIKDFLEAKETKAQQETPEGMEFMGWALDGFLVNYPPMSQLARPVYAFEILPISHDEMALGCKCITLNEPCGYHPQEKEEL